MKLSWARDAGILQYGDNSIKVICAVRNELNGERLLSEPPVYSELEDGGTGEPYMPRPFPKGIWNVLAIIPKENPYEAPEFISTDAHQTVKEWSLDSGHYGAETEDAIEDYGYGFHNSTSSTTLGCGHILSSDDRAALTAAIKEALANGESVILEVV